MAFEIPGFEAVRLVSLGHLKSVIYKTQSDHIDKFTRQIRTACRSVLDEVSQNVGE